MFGQIGIRAVQARTPLNCDLSGDFKQLLRAGDIGQIGCSGAPPIDESFCLLSGIVVGSAFGENLGVK